MKVSELEGAELDYWVAKAEAIRVEIVGCRVRFISNGYSYEPSRSWDQGGPIIERERMSIGTMGADMWKVFIIRKRKLVAEGEGHTLLTAAMRCYIAMKFGDEVPDA